MNPPKPLTESQKQQVVVATADYIWRAEEVFQRHFDLVPILFDLKGRAAGLYRVRGSERVIRYNPWIFARYFDDNLAVTVPHEVAHYVSDMVHGAANIKPHGAEWKQLMAFFGVDASRTCDYDIEGLPLRRQQRFSYSCACSEYEISATRHNRVQRGIARYHCRRCGTELRR